MELRGQRMEKGVEAAVQEPLAALSDRQGRSVCAVVCLSAAGCRSRADALVVG